MLPYNTHVSTLSSLADVFLFTHVQVFPAHGAGSPCGKNLSSDLYSTIGKQKLTNSALSFTDVGFLSFSLSLSPSLSPHLFLIHHSLSHILTMNTLLFTSCQCGSVTPCSELGVSIYGSVYECETSCNPLPLACMGPVQTIVTRTPKRGRPLYNNG